MNKASIKEINLFMTMFEEKIYNTLILHNYDMSTQIEAVKKNGDFLADVGVKNYEVVTSKLADIILMYVIANDKNKSLSTNINDEIEQVAKHYKRTKTFVSYLSKPLSNEKSKKVTVEEIMKEMLAYPNKEDNRNYADLKYILLYKLLEEYQEDLNVLITKYDSKIINQGMKILPIQQFSKDYSKSKTELENFLKDIAKKYNLSPTAQKIKKLKDSLFYAT